MPSGTKQVTVRQHLLGNVLEFINEAQMQWSDTTEALTEVAVSLPGYREEEISLYPLVVICDDLEATIGADQRVIIGAGNRDARTAAEAIKKCAPLAEGAWCIFLERGAGGFRFGVFRPSTFSFAVDPQDILEAADLGANRVCVVRALSENAVELLNDRGSALHLNLSAQHPQEHTVQSAIRSIVNHIMSDIPVEAREIVKPFFVASLTRAIQNCHGTLIAVQRAGNGKRWCEGNWLDEPIDVAKSLVEVSKVVDKLGVARSLGNDFLIKGMIRSDGITVFSTDAKILAFGGFIRLPAAQGVNQGGARTRAYDALSRLVGKELRAVLKVSQDGGVSYLNKAGRK